MSVRCQTDAFNSANKALETPSTLPFGVEGLINITIYTVHKFTVFEV